MTTRGKELIEDKFKRLFKDWHQFQDSLTPTEVKFYGGNVCFVIGKILKEFAAMQTSSLKITQPFKVQALDVRKRPDTFYVTEMPWENSTALHNPNSSLMTLLAALDNELWLFKVWPPAKLPNQCEVTKICDQGTRIDANLNSSITQQPLNRFGRPNTHFEAKHQESQSVLFLDKTRMQSPMCGILQRNMSHAVQKMPQNPRLMPPAESLRLTRRFRKILKNLMEWYIKFSQMETSQDPLGPDIIITIPLSNEEVLTYLLIQTLLVLFLFLAVQLTQWYTASTANPQPTNNSFHTVLGNQHYIVCIITYQY
ncbi:hypothetical protein DSO57_1014725 [Entomophthora muscae]|uniref:Uncharacterized protein n=1 Tax=Entomophthora muscae TaxID=34485 RepID=A0ACC2U334_9FUNG|nr:hypothetical protein DSO57_1014725 [Entomophthora muscae]